MALYDLWFVMLL